MALTALTGPWPLLRFHNLFHTDDRTPWTSDKPVASLYLYTGQHKHRINAYTDIHALSGIRIHDPSVRASEDSSCLRPRGHRDLHSHTYYVKIRSSETSSCLGITRRYNPDDRILHSRRYEGFTSNLILLISAFLRWVTDPPSLLVQ
jgi:hypothetical protein